MDRTSELECYLYFMWNAWGYSACRDIFGGMAKHYWDKWIHYCHACGSEGAPAPFYMALDEGARKKLKASALDHYRID